MSGSALALNGGFFRMSDVVDIIAGGEERSNAAKAPIKM